MTPTLVRRYPRLVKEAASESGFDVLEVDPEQRNIFGVVKGLDGLSLDEIEDKAHEAMARIFKTNAAEIRDSPVYPVESGIAAVDFPMGDVIVRKGSWFMGLHVADPAAWSEVEREFGVQSVAKQAASADALAPLDLSLFSRLVGALERLAAREPAAPVIHNHVAPAEVHAHVETPEVHVHNEAPTPRSIKVVEKNGVKRFVPEL